MLAETLLLAFAIGLLSGGRLKNLTNLHVRCAGLIFAGLFVRYIPRVINQFMPTLWENQLFGSYGITLLGTSAIFFILSYLLIITGVSFNFREWTMMIILVGIVMNFIVVAANGGFMPVSAIGLKNAGYPMSRIVDGIIDLNHIVGDKGTRLLLLADIIPIKKPYPFPKMLSIGDVIMCFGFFLYVFTKLRLQPSKISKKSKTPSITESSDGI